MKLIEVVLPITRDDPVKKAKQLLRTLRLKKGVKRGKGKADGVSKKGDQAEKR